MPQVKDVASPAIATIAQKALRGQAGGKALTIRRTDLVHSSAAAPAGSVSLSAAGLALSEKANGPLLAPQTLKIGIPSVQGPVMGPMGDAKAVKPGTEAPRADRQSTPKDPATGTRAAALSPGATKAATSRDEVRIPVSLGPNDEARRAPSFGGLNVRRSTGGVALTVNS